jgi:sarcosine oxidase
MVSNMHQRDVRAVQCSYVVEKVKVDVKHFEAIIVGCGGMGSSVSYHLATQGLKVLTLEKFRLNHEFGSSHGKTRIIRLAYFEDTRYVPLLRRAYDLWNRIQQVEGERIITITGGLMIGPPEGEMMVGALKSAQFHSIPHRLLTGSEASEEFKVFKLDADSSALYDPSAGIIFPERAISASVGLAKQEGAEFRFEEPVTSWERKGDRYEVHTSTGDYSADKVVFCAGPWMNELLGNLIPIEVERQVLFWFGTSNSPEFSPPRMPVFLMESDGGRYFYGIPDVGQGVKIARHHGGMIVDPNLLERNVSKSDEAPVRDFVLRRIPDLNSDPINSSVCLYSNTTDRNFIIDFHPGHDRALIVSACSGHGFKFASVLGEVVADLLVGREPKVDISFLRAKRFLS